MVPIHFALGYNFHAKVRKLTNHGMHPCLWKMKEGGWLKILGKMCLGGSENLDFWWGVVLFGGMGGGGGGDLYNGG